MTARLSTYDKFESCHMFYFSFIFVDASAINIAVNFQKVQTSCMLMAQPSTYDMFQLMELYGRKYRVFLMDCRHIANNKVILIS